MIDVMRKAITTIKSAGGTVSFDPNIRKEMLSIPEMAQALDYLIEYTDIFIPSESELLSSRVTKICQRNRLLAIFSTAA